MAQLIWQSVKFLTAFAVVIFLAAAASRYLATRAQGGTLSAFRVLGAIGLGAGRSLAAVQVGQRILILGLGDKNISLLCVVDDPAEIGAVKPEGATGTGDAGGPGAGPVPSVVDWARSALDRVKHRA